MNDSSTARMARAIFDAHAATLALPRTPPGADLAPAAGLESDDPVFRAAWQAADALGFVPADALCVARAWQRQQQRTGKFDPWQWPAEPADFGLAPWPRAETFAPCPRALGLYAVLPDAAWVGRMARAGVPTLQLRFKSADAAAVRGEVRAAVAAVQGTGARLFINDHWREAVEAGAYGVHLGQEDLDRLADDDIAALRSTGLRLGLSTHGYAEMLRADALSPSYVAMGAVFPTTLKAMPTAPQGVGRLRAYAGLMRQHSLVAIGGIDAARLPAVLASGVGSVAFVRAITAAPSPEKAAAALAEVMACAAPSQRAALLQ